MENAKTETDKQSFIYFEFWENEQKEKDKRAEQNFKSLLAIQENGETETEETETENAINGKGHFLIFENQHRSLKELLKEPKTARIGKRI